MADAGDLVNLTIADGLLDEGGDALAEIAEASRVDERWAVDEGWSCTIETPASASWVPSIQRRRVLWLEQADGSIREYRISELEDGLSGGPDVVTFRGQDPIVDLAERAIWSETLGDGTVLFDSGIGAATPAEILASQVIAQAQAKGIAVELGTVAPDLTLTSFRWTGPVSLLTLVDQLIAAIRERGGQAERHYARDPGNGYLLHVPHEIGSAATSPELYVGRHVPRWKRKRKASELASRVFPFGGVDATGYRATLARAAWRVSDVDVGNSQITLVDPNGGPGPVQFADQGDPPEGPWQVEAVDGTRVEVTNSVRVSETDSLLTLTGVSAFTEGDIVEIRADAAGTFLTSLVHPMEIQDPPTGVGPMEVPLDLPALRGERNLVPNPWCRAWSGAPTDLPDGWTTGLWRAFSVNRTTDPLDARLGPYALVLTSSAGFADAWSPAAPIVLRSTTDLFSPSWALRVDPAGSMGLRFYIASEATDDILWFRELSPDQIRAGRWTVSFAAAALNKTLAGADADLSQGVRLGIAHWAIPGGVFTIVVDAVQLTQTTAPADALFEGARGNALWQAANGALFDAAVNPPGEFEGEILDYARIDPAQFAHLAIEPGCTARVLDEDRGLDWSVRAVVLEMNRLVRGQTRIRWARRVRPIAVATGHVGLETLGPGSVVAPPATPGDPGNPGDPQPPGQPASPSASLLYTVYADADGTTLDAFPSATTERNSLQRQVLPMDGMRCARLAARVLTPLSGTKLRAEFHSSIDDAWKPVGQYADDSDGPWVSLSAEGEFVGDDVVLDPEIAGDTLLRFVEEGGDDASDVVVGNVTLQCTSGPPRIQPAPGCGLSGLHFLGDDFAGGGLAPESLPAYADQAEFETYLATTAAYEFASALTLAPAILDYAVTYNGRPTLKLPWGGHQDNYPGPSFRYRQGWAGRFAGPGESPPTEISEVWARLRLNVEAGLEWIGTGFGDPLNLIYLTTGVGQTTRISMDGSDLLLKVNSSAHAPTGAPNYADEVNLGSSTSLLAGQDWVDVILRVVHSGSDAKVRAWMGPACTAGLPRLGEVTAPGFQADYIEFVFLHTGGTYLGSVPTDVLRVIRLADWEFSTDANPFGVADP